MNKDIKTVEKLQNELKAQWQEYVDDNISHYFSKQQIQGTSTANTYDGKQHPLLSYETVPYL